MNHEYEKNLFSRFPLAGFRAEIILKSRANGMGMPLLQLVGTDVCIMQIPGFEASALIHC